MLINLINERLFISGAAAAASLTWRGALSLLYSGGAPGAAGGGCNRVPPGAAGGVYHLAECGASPGGANLIAWRGVD